MRTDDFAVTVALRVAMVTTSIAGILGIWQEIRTASKSRSDVLYDLYPIYLRGISLVFVSVMWMSITLSFLLYMSFRVRNTSSGPASYVDYSPSGSPSSGANARRQASST